MEDNGMERQLFDGVAANVADLGWVRSTSGLYLNV